ncbi:hypothetical protein [Hymenobacter nivis]|uniref:Uncharacterized protein n=1 Tax=Hymenobacter nivis TaxID=1850093 RepID=A0A502GEK3_9BACT|nr:hypothetical protein [Hymenobacter nivis]TPG59476.1 hypothetical protein EAH73_21430 [Hymenobacter nivis]
MAKTFKNLPRPGEAAAPKPTSERDFFDLSDERTPGKNGPDPSESGRNTSNTGNISNTGNAGNAGIAAQMAGALDSPFVVAAASDGVRQTFVVGRGHLEQLRDYVHARRSQGEYTYSQKQALQEALNLLFASSPPIPQRPEQTRRLEQQQQERIKRGRAG